MRKDNGSTPNHRVSAVNLFLTSLAAPLGGTDQPFRPPWWHSTATVLTHITDGETTEGSVISEGFNTQRLSGDELDEAESPDSTNLGALRWSCWMTVESWRGVRRTCKQREQCDNRRPGVTSEIWPGWLRTMTWALKEPASLAGRSWCRRWRNHWRYPLVETFLTLETNVITGVPSGRIQVHFGRTWLSGHGRGEVDNHTGADNTSSTMTDRDSSDTTQSCRRLEGRRAALSLDGLGFNSIDGFWGGYGRPWYRFHVELRILEPGHVGGDFQHVITVPSGQGIMAICSVL